MRRNACFESWPTSTSGLESDEPILADPFPEFSSSSDGTRRIDPTEAHRLYRGMYDDSCAPPSTLEKSDSFDANVTGSTQPPVAESLLGGILGGFDTGMNWFGGLLSGNVRHDETSNSGRIGMGVFGGTTASADGKRSVAGGAMAPLANTHRNKMGTTSVSTNVYTGGGMSSAPGGNGVDASVTPIGFANTNFVSSNDSGATSLHADNAYVKRVSGGANWGYTPNTTPNATPVAGGNYSASVTGGMQSGVEGARVGWSNGERSIGLSAQNMKYGTSGGLSGNINTAEGTGGISGRLETGFRGTDIGFSENIGTGETTNANIGGLKIGNSLNGDLALDTNTGTLTGQGGGRVGGVVVTNSTANFRQKNEYGTVNAGGSLGEFSNDLKIEDASLLMTKDRARGNLSLDGDGVRFQNAQVGAGLTNNQGQTVASADARVGMLGGGNSIKNASFDLQGMGRDQSLDVGFQELAYGGWSGNNLAANTRVGDASVGATVGEFNQGLTVKSAAGRLDRHGARTSVGEIDYGSNIVKNAGLDFDMGNGHTGSARLGEGVLNSFDATNVRAGVNLDRGLVDSGLYANAESARYDTALLKNVRADERLRLSGMDSDIYRSNASMGEGSMNTFAANNIQSSLTLRGLDASLENGRVRSFAGENLNVGAAVLGDRASARVSATSASVGGGDAGAMMGNLDAAGARFEGVDVGAHALRTKGLSSQGNVAALETNFNTGSLSAADLTIGRTRANVTSGLRGSASIQNANLDVANVQDARMRVGWNQDTLVDARGSGRVNAGLEEASGEYDAYRGTTSGRFRNASVGGSLENVQLEAFGKKAALPQASARLNATGDTDLDMRRRAGRAHVDLAGSNANIAGTQYEIGDWAQADAAFDYPAGRSNVQLGGQNGIGYSYNNGNLDVNIGGTSAEEWAKGAASTVGSGVSDARSWVGDTASVGVESVLGLLLGL
ncbi:MAG: hypothetical protein ACKV2T_01045 [Kofleriaceae bacterium]